MVFLQMREALQLENFYIKNQSNGISCTWVNGKINGKENSPWI